MSILASAGVCRAVGLRTRVLAVSGLAATVVLAAAPAQALLIVPIYDASVTSRSNAAQIEQAFQTVANEFDAAFAAPVTLKIPVGWGEVDGQALKTGDISESMDFLRSGYTYANVTSYLKSAAAANPTDLNLASAVAHLPVKDPTATNSFSIPYAEAQVLGLLPKSMYLNSGYVGFASNVSWNFASGATPAGQYDFMALAAHEISEVMGRVSALKVAKPGYATILDLFRYSAPGVSGFSYTSPAYFSVNGGVTNIGDFNVAGSGDRGDWSSSLVPGDDQDAYLCPGVTYTLSASDLTQLDVLGWGAFTAPLSSDPGVPGAALISGGGSVPEPAAWTIMLLGFCLTGSFARKRRAKAAQA
jgi:hypothetical protein